MEMIDEGDGDVIGDGLVMMASSFEGLSRNLKHYEALIMFGAKKIAPSLSPSHHSNASREDVR